MSHEGGSSPERQEKPGIVYLYAIDSVQTTQDSVTRQGFGYSSPLKKPIATTRFAWDGILYPTEMDKSMPDRAHGVRTGAVREKVEDLALGFADQYRRTKPTAGPAYQLTSSSLPSKPMFAGTGTLRTLTETEHDQFMDAFRRANEAATR